MERIKKDTRYILGQCQSFLCSYNAFNYCRNHKLKICTPCSVVFHCSCDIKIVNGKEFCDIAMEILEELVESLSKEGMNLGIDRYSEDYKESVLKIVDIDKELRTKYNHDEIDVATEDEYIKDLRKIIKDVLESQAYNLSNNT